MTTLTIPRVTGVSFLGWLQQEGRLRKVANTHGGEYAGPCPFCGGKDRFRVWPEQGKYWCRQCGAHGDAIDYLQQKHGLTFGEAVRAMGGALPARQAATPVKACQKATTPFWAGVGEKLAQERHADLLATPDALAYLHGRGLNDGTIAEFGLGWNEWAGSYYGLSLPRGWTIPLYGVDGRFYGLQVRQPDGMTPKYKLVAGSHWPLLGRLTGKPYLLVAEGGFDAMLAWQEVGELVDVATLGSCTADPRHWVAHLLGYERILLCHDADDAGEQGRANWADFGNVAHVRLPLAGGKDITDFVLAGGNLRAWVQSLLPGQEQQPSDRPCPACGHMAWAWSARQNRYTCFRCNYGSE